MDDGRFRDTSQLQFFNSISMKIKVKDCYNRDIIIHT